MNVVVIKNNIIIDCLIFENLQVAQSFINNGFLNADIVMELPDNFGIGDIFENGKFIKKIKTLSIEEIRNMRNLLLLQSDWTQLIDVQDIMLENKKQEWTNYRQQLRDLPLNIDLNNPIFPEKPL